MLWNVTRDPRNVSEHCVLARRDLVGNTAQTGDRRDFSISHICFTEFTDANMPPQTTLT